MIEQHDPRDIVLIYCSYSDKGPLNWDKEKFKYYIAYFDNDKTPIDILFDTFLFMYRKSSRGHLFEFSWDDKPTDKKDWLEALDRFFAKDHQLFALEEASYELSVQLNRKVNPKVILTLPYPDIRQEKFGVIEYENKKINLNFLENDSARLMALKWYIDETLKRWQKAKFKNIKLIGFYWFNETHLNHRTEFILCARKKMRNSKYNDLEDDFSLMKLTSEYIHSNTLNGRRLTITWIPYHPYGDERQYLNFSKLWLEQNEKQKVDYLIIQPNYFFPRWKKSREDLRNIINNAKKIGAGVEVEFNNTVLTDREAQERLFHYLNEIKDTGEYYWKTYLGYYQSGDTVYQLATKKSFRKIYERLVKFIQDRRKYLIKFSKGGK